MSPAVTNCLATCIPSSGAHHNPEDNANHLLPCQTSLVAPTAPHPMPFKNEVVSDEDIDRYNLPFPKGEGRWWTRDAERDYYLWGGRVGNLAYEDSQEGWFYLYIGGVTYDIYLEPGQQEKDALKGEMVFRWRKITRVNPELSQTDFERVVGILKEALVSFGFDGRQNIYFPHFRVEFDF